MKTSVIMTQGDSEVRVVKLPKLHVETLEGEVVRLSEDFWSQNPSYKDTVEHLRLLGYE
jgi:hypothetical protein